MRNDNLPLPDTTPNRAFPSSSSTILVRLQQDRTHLNVVDSIVTKVDTNKRVGVVWKIQLQLPIMSSTLECYPREMVVPSNKCTCLTLYSKPIACPNCDRLLQLGAHVVANRDRIELKGLFMAVIPLKNKEMTEYTGAHVHRDEAHMSQNFILVKTQFQDKINYSYWTVII